MTRTWSTLIRQRRFQLLLVILILVAVALGLIMVPVERGRGNSLFNSAGDGLWWAVTAVTGVAYGDIYPKSVLGKIIGAALEIVGVVTLGLLVATISVAIRHRQERWYWHRLFRRLDDLEGRLDKLEKKSNFGLKNGMERHEETPSN